LTALVVYADKASVSNLSDTANGTVKLYAVWKPNENAHSVQDWVLGKSSETVTDVNGDGVVDVFDIAALRQK